MSSTTILILIAIGVAVCCVITATGFVLHNVILIRAVQRNTSWTVPARDCCDTWRGCYEHWCYEDSSYDADDKNLGCCEREKHICLCFGIYECLRPGHKEAVAAEAKVKSERIAARTAANNADGHITITRTSSVNPLSFLAGAIRDDVNELTEPLRYITARAPIIKVRKVKDIAPPAPQAQEQARGVVGGDGAVEDDGAAATEGATVGHPTSDWTRHWHDDHAAYYWQHTDADGQGTHESQWTEPTSEETAAQNTLAGKAAAQQSHPPLAITVPPGVGPGQLLQVQNPYTGQTLQVQVPEGHYAGAVFHAAVSVAPPVQSKFVRDV